VQEFDFSAFMRQFALSRSFCSKVFGVSERTVTRWRSARKIPASALQLVRTIEHQAPPWNAGFRRSWHCGIVALAWTWRQLLFAPPGGTWQQYRSAEDRQRAAAMAARGAAYQAEREEARRRARLAAGRKAAATRKARRSRIAADGDLAGEPVARTLQTPVPTLRAGAHGPHHERTPSREARPARLIARHSARSIHHRSTHRTPSPTPTGGRIVTHGGGLSAGAG
jgi:hypothetical protein